jgi:hypothetical protein
MNYFRWDKKEEAHSDFFRFCRILIKFRDECESLGLNDFPTAKRLQWHGLAPEIPNWSETSRFVAFSLVPFSHTPSLTWTVSLVGDINPFCFSVGRFCEERNLCGLQHQSFSHTCFATE